MAHDILTPVLALICWSLLMWLLMYLRRIPGMQKAKIDPQDAKHPGSLDALPSTTRAAADNYNHLMEQPTIFYALIFYMHISGIATATAVMLAWAYVTFRVAHSLMQVTLNLVMVRFGLFVLSTLMLVGLAVISVMATL